ncbi:MAG: hypothetical protein H6833_00165 [Planctomycetes bacterium]|nr:hypothetical protein [Planctomycetota bacterium]
MRSPRCDAILGAIFGGAIGSISGGILLPLVPWAHFNVTIANTLALFALSVSAIGSARLCAERGFAKGMGRAAIGNVLVVLLGGTVIVLVLLMGI